MKALHGALKVRDRVITEIDETIVQRLGIKDGELLRQELLPDGGILLRREKT